MSDRFDHTLEHKLESKAGSTGDTGVVRRLELISGTGRRRQWSSEEKARILLESLEPDANVSEVARRHGMSPQQLFGWRRQLRCDPAAGRSGAHSKVARAAAGEPRQRGGRPRRDRGESGPTADAPAFAPVVVASASASPVLPPTSLSSTASSPFAAIEIVIGDCTVRVIGQVEPQLLVAVMRAVRRAT